jgi:SAM-dependent methyltransferase
MSNSATNPYGDDLAFVHDAGFGHVAQNAASELLKQLRINRKKRLVSQRVVDLGCGSGILAHAVSAAGFQVLGFDVSDGMLALAAKRVPLAVFRRESFITAELPPCLAVTAIGEVVNYLFDSRNRGQQLLTLMSRVYEALCPGGLFLFDVAEPGRVRGSGVQRGYSEGNGWACLYSAEEDRRRKTLTRTITTFRKVGEHHRRRREVHRLRLHPRAVIAEQLRRVGFQARTLSGYGRFRFPVGWVGFIARKPAR